MNSQMKEASELKKIYNRIRDEKHLDYAVVADLMGLGVKNRSQVSHMLNGINPINLERGLQFCEIMDITLDEWSPRLSREANEVARRVIGRVRKPIDGNVKYLIGMDATTILKNLQGKSTASDTVYWPGEHSETTYMVRVEGESCDPELPRGSIAVIDADRKPVPGKFFAFLEGSLKFAKYNGDGFAEFVNPGYPDRVFKITKKMKSLGLVIGLQKQY